MSGTLLGNVGGKRAYACGGSREQRRGGRKGQVMLWEHGEAHRAGVKGRMVVRCGGGGYRGQQG